MKLSWRAAASKAFKAFSGGSRRGIAPEDHEKISGKLEQPCFVHKTGFPVFDGPRGAFGPLESAFMDTLALGLFLVASFFGGMSTGLVGFAMGLVVSGIWLHIITPLQTATLIARYSVVTQGYKPLEIAPCAGTGRRVAPFLIGGVIGVPIGAILLTYFNYIQPAYLRTPGWRACWCCTAATGLARPAFKPMQQPRGALRSRSNSTTGCSAG